MDEYIEMWLDIIENMNNDNTYKLAWGRAIIEIACEMKNVGERNEVGFDQIALKMLKYYWNQVFFFNLKQSPSKVPVVVQETEKCIEYYKTITQSSIPVWFDKAELTLMKYKEHEYKDCLRRIKNKLGDDVSYRFMNCKGKVLPVYELERKNKRLYLTNYQVEQLKEYAFVLSQLLNYKWAQLLEKFNSAPRITSKVKGISATKIRRENLKKFKDVLLAQYDNGNITDFYTGEILNENDISVDHVIPWSFMYSDDIWNLVLTSKSENSRKSNHIPSEEVIEKLVKRNEDLVLIIEDGKFKNDLQVAIQQDYVHKFYLACKL